MCLCAYMTELQLYFTSRTEVDLWVHPKKIIAELIAKIFVHLLTSLDRTEVIAVLSRLLTSLVSTELIEVLSSLLNSLDWNELKWLKYCPVCSNVWMEACQNEQLRAPRERHSIWGRGALRKEWIVSAENTIIHTCTHTNVCACRSVIDISLISLAGRSRAQSLQAFPVIGHCAC